MNAIAVELRNASPADAPAIAALINRLAAAGIGQRETPKDVAEWFDLPGLETAIAVAPDGEVVGYADLQRSEGSSLFHLDVREDAERRGAAPALVAELEGRAGRQGVADGRIRAYVPAAEDSLGEVLDARGYAVVRVSFTMRRELDDAPAPPAWPEGIAVRAVRPGVDDEAVYEAHMEAFEDHWGFERQPFEEWRKMIVPTDHDPSLWLLAEDGGSLAGVALSRVRDGNGWVDVLAVRRPWRRRGLGAALLQASFGALHRRGLRRVELGVDGENTTGAVRLYERAGMHVVQRRQTWERSL